MRGQTAAAVVAADYGAVGLVPLGVDAGGNPICRRDRAAGDLVVLRLRSGREGHARYAVNLTSTVLCRMAHHKWITRTEYDAGQIFRADFHGAGLTPNVASNYSPLSVGGVTDRDDRQEGAYRRWRGAVVALGNGKADAISSVILEEIPPLRDGQMAAFRDGMKRLCQHYRF
jgi:hypothetical protein